ncbi:MAG: hypothetical protein QXF95_02780 [Candidatus Caldarchaeum sp.]
MNRPFEGLSFTFNIPSDPFHEIDGVVRGLGPVLDDVVLVGEGMGLGGVVGILGKRAIFPLHAETKQVDGSRASRKILLNGVSVKYFSAACVDPLYKKLRTVLAPLYLESRPLRPFYFMLMAGRTLAGVKSRYLRLKTYGHVDVEYLINGCRVEIAVRRNTPRKMRVLVANELSGRLFTHMRVDGVRKPIPPWMKLGEGVVELVSPSLKLVMTVHRRSDATAYVGREVLGRRLDWAGVSLEVPAGENKLSYSVVFEKLE